ncbi:MFS transporter [Paenibacillus sp. YYML68]|uniref:MFS transporter n=1 Tax=Paenibacillus sp. YYML68 TaxID=2909250 RepID=UPI002492A313|nr:MFS transporter [Paenibacillus sp. YYML68]
MNARSWWLMISVGLGMLLNPLNSSMVAVAIPRLQHVYRLDFTMVSWIIFSFYIASAIANPVMGKASDLFGRKKIFLLGLIVALIASLFAPYSPTFGWLLVCRIVQSIGTSMLLTAGMAIIRTHTQENQATAISVLTVFQSGAAAIGPFIGGMLIYTWDWHAIFAVNVPFVVLSLLLCYWIIPKDESMSTVAQRLTLRQWLDRIDSLGILLFTAGLVSLLIGLLSAKSTVHVSWLHVTAIVAGVVLLGTFIQHERRAAAPFIPLPALARYPAITRVNVNFMLVNVLFYALFFGIPSYLQTVRHLSELHTGILMLTLGLSSLLITPFAGRWVDRSGPRPALRLAAMLMTLGAAWILTWTPTSPLLSVCLGLAAFGIANGLSNVSLQATLFRSSPQALIGVASGLFSTARNLGAILSSLLIGIVLGKQFSFGGFRTLGLILVCFALSLVFTSWKHRESEQVQES